jgi:hypothetical protein
MPAEDIDTPRQPSEEPAHDSAAWEQAAQHIADIRELAENPDHQAGVEAFIANHLNPNLHKRKLGHLAVTPKAMSGEQLGEDDSLLPNERAELQDDVTMVDLSSLTRNPFDKGLEIEENTVITGSHDERLERQLENRDDGAHSFGEDMLGAVPDILKPNIFERHQRNLRKTIMRNETTSAIMDKLPIVDDLRDRLTNNGSRGVLEGLSECEMDDFVAFAGWNRKHTQEHAAWVNVDQVEHPEDYDGEELEEPNETERAIIEYYQDFKHSLQTAIEEQGLPITLSEVQNRLSNLRIRTSDPLLVELQGENGTFDALTQEIMICAVDDPTELRETVYHELLHAISGLTMSIEPNESEANYDSDVIHALRAGLGGPDNRLHWLNEAITEQLTQILVADQPVDFNTLTGIDIHNMPEWHEGVYNDERELLVVIMDSGVEHIPFKTLLEAYFEEYQAPYTDMRGDIIVDTGNPEAALALYDAIDRAYGLDGALEEMLYEDAESSPLEVADLLQDPMWRDHKDTPDRVLQKLFGNPVMPKRHAGES